LREIEQQTEDFQTDYNIAHGKLESIMTCIQSIFNLLDCESNSELLGTQGVTELNMMIFMGIIEQRINELLQANTYILNGKQYDERDNNVLFAEKMHFGQFFGGASSMQ